jgi:hypothetical protein
MARNEDVMSGGPCSDNPYDEVNNQEKTSTRPERKFMSHSGCGVRVAKTTKNAKRGVIGVRVIKSKVWGGCANGFGGEAIKDVSGVMKSFYPKIRR